MQGQERHTAGPRNAAAPWHVRAEDALGVVGLSPRTVTELVAPELGAGHAYLVGSLAGGLGNRSSDVDIHVLDPAVTQPIGPRLHRLDEVPVDIERFPPHAPAELAGPAPGPADTLRFPAGDVALDRPLGRSAQRRAARWAHALPLAADAPPVYDAGQAARVRALLARVTFDRLTGLACLAGLADRAGHPAGTRRHLWRQAGRQLLELRCRLAGDLTTGDKWLPVRARRLGLANAPCDSAADLRTALADAGLPDLTRLPLASVRPAHGSSEVTFAGRAFVLNRHDRLLPEGMTCAAPVAEAAEQHGAARLLAAVARAELDLTVQDDTLRKVCGSWLTTA